MKKNNLSIEDVKKTINNLKGHEINIQVNKGRKKTIKFNCEVKDVYPGVFTVKVINPVNVDVISYAYTDVLCGNVIIQMVNNV